MGACSCLICHKECKSTHGFVLHAKLAHGIDGAGDVERVCPNCGAKKAIKPSLQKRTRYSFCNSTCEDEWRRRTGTYSPKLGRSMARGRACKITVLVCSWCGKSVTYTARIARRRKNAFCNGGECERSWRAARMAKGNNPNHSGGEWLPCLTCGKSVWNFPADLKIATRRFCDTACYHAFWSGENHSAWTGGASTQRGLWFQNGGRGWIRACRKRDNYTCRICNKQHDKRSRGLHVHHIAPFATYETLRSVEANGATLCKDCHDWLHSNDGEPWRAAWEAEIVAELGHLLERETVAV